MTEESVDRDVDQRACPHCGELKHTPRSPELKASVTRRINRAVGQLNGIRAMVEEDRYCGDVLTQLAAVESAVKAISREDLRRRAHPGRRHRGHRRGHGPLQEVHVMRAKVTVPFARWEVR